MPTGRFWKATRLSLLLALIGAQQAHAALFDDEEARRLIKDLSIQTNERVDTLAKAQMELLNQITALREENAKLRGSLETLNFELESAKKRQQDFYIDLDGRLRKLETPETASAENAPTEEGAPAAEDPKKSTADPAAESRDYEAALNLFKANKISEAASAFDAFTKTHPESTLAPNARAIPMADATAQTLPTLSPSSTGQRMARTLPSCAYSGIASATVAGPSRKCTNCAPAK